MAGRSPRWDSGVVWGSVGDYVMDRELGRGCFGVVWKAHHRCSGFEVAIKVITMNRFDPDRQQRYRDEVATLKAVHHPNVIRLHDVIQLPDWPDRMYLVFEYCNGGTLAQYIKRHHGTVSSKVARRYMSQLGAGLQELRKKSVIHRDLKPQNLLLSMGDGSAELKIADFGHARFLFPGSVAENPRGTKQYRAPECHNGQGYDEKADLWSLGVILCELLTGQYPSSVVDFQGNRVLGLGVNRRSLPPDAIDLCERLLCDDPVKRINFGDFFAHPFLRKEKSTELAEMINRKDYWKNRCIQTDDITLVFRRENEELRRKNEELESENEELESENEELRRKNEELRRKNEELESENEELGSENEELECENEELRRKNEELESENEELGSENEELIVRTRR